MHYTLYTISGIIIFACGFPNISAMKKVQTYALEKALKAFTYHQAVRIKKKDGEPIETGYIMIMYGDLAFRMQPKKDRGESQLVSISEIEEILVDETA